MAKKVVFSIGGVEIGTQGKGFQFAVHNEDERAGHLNVGRGTVFWTPKHGKHSFELDWEKLGKLFEDNGVKKPRKHK